MADGSDARTQKASAKGKRAARTAMLKGRFEIDLERRLADLDSPLAEAYYATDTKVEERQLFALLCRPPVPQRSRIIVGLAGRFCANSLAIVAAGGAAMPDSEGRRYALVLERPLGGRVLSHLAQRGSKLTEREISRTLLPQLAAALANMGEHGVAHRAVRPDNLFYADAARTNVALGECASEPAGYSQPAAYETVERAMAMPEGRGEGTIECDYYALGVTVFELLSGRAAGGGQDDDALLMAKITKGSFLALVGDAPLSNPMRELLGGLLCDDPELRWTAEEVRLWQQGGSRSPRVKLQGRRAARSFRFFGGEYRHDRALALAFARNPREAAEAIRGEVFRRWLFKDLDDADAASEVGAAVGAAEGSGGDDELVAQTCLVLDADSPIRFQNLAICVDGLGPVLASAMAANDRAVLASLTSLIAGSLPTRWIEARFDRRTAAIKSMFVRLQYIVARREAGFGIERCLYELNLSVPCLSPIVAERCVQTIGELFAGLDAAARTAAPDANLADRHLAAFAASRAQGFDKKLGLLSRGDDDVQHRVNMVEFFDDLQRRGRPRPVPHLSAWLARWLEPVVESLHSERRRKQLDKRLRSIARSGDLYALYTLLDSGRELAKDRAEFRRARAEYANLERESHRLENDASGLAQSAKRLGSGTAALIGYTVFLLTTGYVALGVLA